jgi:hypothetical protein
MVVGREMLRRNLAQSIKENIHFYGNVVLESM